MNYIEKIKKAMIEQGMNQKELAKKSGLTEASVCRYLNKERTPKIDSFLKMIQALNLDLNDFKRGM